MVERSKRYRMVRAAIVSVGLLLTIAFVVNPRFVSYWFPSQEPFHELVAELKARGEPVTLDECLPASGPDDENGAPLLREALRWIDETHGADWRSRVVGPWDETAPPDWEAAASPEQMAALGEFLGTFDPFMRLVSQAVETPVIRFESSAAATLAAIDSTDFRAAMRTLARADYEALGWSGVGPARGTTAGDLQTVTRVFAAMVASGRDPSLLLDAMELQFAIPAHWERSSPAEDVVACRLFHSGSAMLRDAVENDRVDAREARARFDDRLRITWRPDIVRAAKRARGWLIHWWSQGLEGHGPFGPRSAGVRFVSPFFGPDRAIVARHPDYVIACSRAVDAIERLDLRVDSDGSEELTAAMGEGRERNLSLIGLPSVFDSLQHADAQCALARVGLAVAVHRQDTGAYPETLEQLASYFPDGVPGDLFSGEAFGYERTADGVRIYSVGDAEVRATDDRMQERRDRVLMWELR